MLITERLYRAELTRAWRDYRETHSLPVAHIYAAAAVRRNINIIRSYASRRGVSRPASWDRIQYRIAAE